MLHDYETILVKNNNQIFSVKSEVQICTKLNGSIIMVQKIIKNGNVDVILFKKNYKQITNVDFVLSSYYKLIKEFFTANTDKLSTKYIYQFVYNPMGFDKIVLNGLFSSKNRQIIDYNLELFELISNKLGIKKNIPIKKFSEDIKFPELNSNKDFREFILNNFKERICLDNIETFIVTVKDEDDKFVFRVDDISQKEHHDFDFFAKIIFSDIIQFMLNYEKYWERLDLVSKEIDDRYLEFIYIVFKVFIQEKNLRYRDLYIKQPTIFKNIIFQMNYDFISDSGIVALLNTHPYYGEIVLKYFILLFNKKKTNKNEFLNDYNLTTQNYLFAKIQKIIN